MKDNIKIGLLTFIAASVGYLAFFKNTITPFNHDQESSTEVTTSASLNNTEPAMMSVDLPKTSIKFENMEHDFGKVKQDTENKYVFSFTNTGSEPLVISNAVGSCGCTVPTYPKEPIEPGKVGQIEVVYSPGKQVGNQVKTVSITANTEPTVTQINIRAEVIQPN